MSRRASTTSPPDRHMWYAKKRTAPWSCTAPGPASSSRSSASAPCTAPSITNAAGLPASIPRSSASAPIPGKRRSGYSASGSRSSYGVSRA